MKGCRSAASLLLDSSPPLPVLYFYHRQVYLLCLLASSWVGQWKALADFWRAEGGHTLGRFCFLPLCFCCHLQKWLESPLWVQLPQESPSLHAIGTFILVLPARMVWLLCLRHQVLLLFAQPWCGNSFLLSLRSGSPHCQPRLFISSNTLNNRFS